MYDNFVTTKKLNHQYEIILRFSKNIANKKLTLLYKKTTKRDKNYNHMRLPLAPRILKNGNAIVLDLD